MSQSRQICTLCDFIYEAPTGEGAVTTWQDSPLDALPESWKCPSCNAPKEFFEQCSCSSFPSHKEAPLAINERLKRCNDGEAIDELFEIASSSVKHFEHSKAFFVPVTDLGPRIHALAISCTENSLLKDKEVLSAFFDGPAIRVILDNSANYYWFWKIVAQSAARTSSLRIGVDTVRAAIEEIRHGIEQHFNLERALCELSRPEIALFATYGIVLLRHSADHSYSLFFNPLFRTNLSTVDPMSPIDQLVLQRPERARVFERFKLDASKRLEEACSQRGINMRSVLRALAASDLSDPDVRYAKRSV
jgi:rubredoxin